MRVLGFDPSLTSFGWALYDSEKNKCLYKGRISTTPKEFENEVDRFIYIRNETDNLISSLDFDFMGSEHPVFGSSQSPAMYCVYMAAMESIKRNSKDLVIWSPTQLKSWARSFITRPAKWKMDKPDMIEAAQKILGSKEKWNHNEADALLVAVFASRWWEYYKGERTKLNEVETHAFVELSVRTKGKNKGKVAYKGVEHSEGEKFFLWSKSETEKIGVKKSKQSKTNRRKT